MTAFEYRHQVSLEETNAVGTVYFSDYVRWQGLCRERFLAEEAPGVVDRLGEDLRLVTTRVTCDYYARVEAFEEIVVRMSLGELGERRLTMDFEYLRQGEDGPETVARGEQEVACMRELDGELVPTEVPGELGAALRVALEGGDGDTDGFTPV